MPVLKEVHLALVSRATGHLALVLATVSRTTWAAGAVLSSDALQAQTAAQGLLAHLDTTAPRKRTAFERHLADTPALMANLTDFANRVPAVCVWQGRQAFKPLFQFLALRFLLAPGQVLDCERVHARWQWLSEAKRNLRMPLLNSWLRTAQYLETHSGLLPAPRALAEHLDAANRARNAALAEVAARDDVAPGLRQHVAAR